MSDERLTCTRMVKVLDGRDAQGKPRHFHKLCGAPAMECEIGGLLAKAKAVLCITHRLQADAQSFTSNNGYAIGKVKKLEKENNYSQERLPGTGLV